jgi:hypothetical protein
VSGPVWQFESNLEATCDECRRRREGMFVEGEVVDNVLLPGRQVCSDCFTRWQPYVVAGEVGRRAPGPAYARGH